MINITFHYRYRKQIIIGIIFIVLLATLTTTIIIYYPKKNKIKQEEKGEILTLKEDTEKESKEETITYKVDIKGQVNAPGIYTMASSSRVVDVIEAAGGLTENANTTVLNLSKKISDEMVIIVYSNEEVADFKKTKEQEKAVQEQCNQKEEGYPRNDACIDSNSTNGTALISINKATVEELTMLPGIGQAKAQDIIDYRLTNGPFQSIEDLKNISGIGESVFAKIKDYITL